MGEWRRDSTGSESVILLASCSRLKLGDAMRQNILILCHIGRTVRIENPVDKLEEEGVPVNQWWQCTFNSSHLY